MPWLQRPQKHHPRILDRWFVVVQVVRMNRSCSLRLIFKLWLAFLAFRKISKRVLKKDLLSVLVRDR